MLDGPTGDYQDSASGSAGAATETLSPEEIARVEEVLNEKESLAAIAYYNLGC